ncbi:MAG: hypothetical protein V4760_19140, partial [Bdellovibrionota bacterium]
MARFLTLILAVLFMVFGAGGSFAAETLEPSDLEREISVRLSRVPEFRYIQEQARALGLRIFLFGGTAAGFAHYVKQDVLRERGDLRFQANRFDYDFTNIYQANQDLDIVVDGSVEQVRGLQSLLQSKFPHLQGEKEAWEVRPLRSSLGEKIALLESPDFLKQNTDSNSVGMIEITDSQEPRVRDLRAWGEPRPPFLVDVAEGKLHFYHSPNHRETSAYKLGRNPEIFSAIRYLIKAVQFELETRPEDLEVVKRIVDEFDPRKLGKDPEYVTRWFEKNGLKLVQNAANLEYAWMLTDSVGLRKKLIDLKGDVSASGSLAWWLSRKPLESFEIGKGRGKTAAELGIKIVAHETSDFHAYESITRSHTGAPNVFSSRERAVGEGAVYGEGFYTKVGREGERGTGITIRFDVDPTARLGTDFDYEKSNQYVVFKNKKAIRVIAETLRLTLPDYLGVLLNSKISVGDRGPIERLERRLTNGMSLIERSEIAEALRIVR